MIRLKNVNKFYQKGRQNEVHVINDISLDLPEKGMVAIFGKSGCGKTTLLNVIGGLDRIESGSISIDGKNVSHNEDELRNRYVGYIFQNYHLQKSQSCYDNVADALRLCSFPEGEEMDARVMAALRNVGMENYRNRTPDTLSGGQQQRIAIARAIVKNPRIILADEPTGNLDESNTVLIMDLLKAISKEHLVLLVTHEANLVDHYCDTVIELRDGQIAGIVNNTSAFGYEAKSKNHIYLGEMQKTLLNDPNANIAFYGEIPEEPLKLRVVNHGGRLYISIDSEKIQVLDSTSEVKLIEGVYEAKQGDPYKERNIDMSALPPIEGEHYGRLFTFISALKSGYRANFGDRKKKKGKRFLQACLGLFAATLVMMFSIFGTAFARMSQISGMYSHNTFYVYTPNGEVSQTLHQGLNDPTTGIDYLRLDYRMTRGDDNLRLSIGSFETFSSYSSTLNTNAVYLDETMCKHLEAVVGKTSGLTENEMVVSTAFADELLKTSGYGYIKEYRDLLGLISTNVGSMGTRAPSIVGIVRSDEKAVYFSELGMAKYIKRYDGAKYSLASEHGMTVENGKAILAIASRDEKLEIPEMGESIQINGKSFTVSDVLLYYPTYEEWLTAKTIHKQGEYEYFKKLISVERPELVNDQYAWNDAATEACTKRYFEYLDYYYAEMDAYFNDQSAFLANNLTYWMYTEKGLIEGAMLFLGHGNEYYQAIKYREAYGKYPTQEELSKHVDALPDLMNELKSAQILYEEEFYKINRTGIEEGAATYFVSDADYIALTKQVGETHASAQPDYYKGGYIIEDVGIGGATINEYGLVSSCYTLIHSNDPSKTEAFLKEQFPNLETGVTYLPAKITPQDLRADLEEEYVVGISVGLITMAIILGIMFVCMYFIMRSSLMGRIKEIGIYRAIGVSKKNLIFKFLIESLVLTSLTVFVGYLLSSLFVGMCLGLSPLLEMVFFYPLWFALVILALLYGLCILCGIIPIAMLLRKTPSEILSKYDI